MLTRFVVVQSLLMSLLLFLFYASYHLLYYPSFAQFLALVKLSTLHAEYAPYLALEHLCLGYDLQNHLVAFLLNGICGMYVLFSPTVSVVPTAKCPNHSVVPFEYLIIFAPG